MALATATRAYRELEDRGLIVGEHGRGVFVKDPSVPLTLGVEQTAADGLVDLVFNMPGADCDVEFLRSGLKRIAAAGDLEAMLRYQPHGGRPHERKILADHLAKTLGAFSWDQFLIVSGAQHGLSTVVLALFKTGEVVATDALTYTGFKTVAALHGLNLTAVASSEGMMDPDDLDRLCRCGKIRAVYLMPTVHNPLGTVMSEERRRQIVAVARRHDLIIIEDAAYAFLEPCPPASLLEFAPERTFHVGGFSKSIGTGLRLGYVIAPKDHVDELSLAIRATTWNVPAIISALIIGWIEDGTLERSEENRRRDGAYRQQICREHLQGITVISHRNASFAWLPLDSRQRAEPIITRLIAKGFAVSGGSAFAVTEAVPQALRVAFGGVKEDQLRKALDCVREEMLRAQEDL
ncbi:transcriptional regulator, GntR family [Aidingimonas halophila]|uniref:Transcriptional regulator, GntR family n=1 Tax=Aidingimonas halophila TaxID=574349 RepID=A0A1H2ZVQ7_9GAMM|nr:transcriptional regulator, GntR family [Aidingimonas halophila]